MDPTVPPQAGKARSRLQNRQESSQQPKSTRVPISRHVEKKFPNLTNRYITYWPLLVITLLHIFVVQKIVVSINPESWKHFILPNTYLPMLLLLTSTTFFASSYLFLNTGRGLRIALIVFLFYFFTFQNVLITVPVILTLVSLFIVLELLSLLLQKKRSRKSA